VAFFVVLALLLPPEPPAQKSRFSIEDVLSSPFPSNLVASPAKGRVAWIENDRGVRNVLVAEGASAGQRRTTFDKDDGQELSELVWSPDGETLAFTRGGSPNSRGEAPNPASDPVPPERTVYLIRPDGARAIGEGHEPALSSRGLLAFVRGREVWAAPLEGGSPSRLFHCGGQASSLRFSPDGSRLAFLSQRGDHNLIGVYDLSQKAVTYPDPGVDEDFDPAWSPDGSRLAFFRIPASTVPFSFGPQRASEPWSIRVVDVAKSTAREVFKAEAGTGSHFRFLPISNQILWVAEDRLVFPWEKTGFVGLYSVPAGGGAPIPLAAGSFEVEYVALSADLKTVIFNSNEGDTDRRHVFSVAVSGGKRAARTKGAGIEWSPVLASDGALAYLASEARRPASVQREGKELAPPGHAFVPESDLVTPEGVLVSAADGMTIHAQLFRPRVPAGHKSPAVLFFHGGPWRQMLLGWHYLDYYSNAYAMNQYLASRGYVVLSVNYRSGIGYGMEFREALNYGAHGASEFADVLGAGLYLRSRPDVDPERIGLWGGSYGGYLTALGLSRASDLFAAGVDIHGVHDWNVELPVFGAGYDPDKKRELARIAYESSPVSSVSTWRSPVLFIHGDDDRTVPFSETVTLTEALRKQGVPVEHLVLVDEVHDILRFKDWARVYSAAADFFDRKLGSESHPRP
jgi:dipeptidyl aminopeptidase/acylaminoacyl peptidase